MYSENFGLLLFLWIVAVPVLFAVISIFGLRDRSRARESRMTRDESTLDAVRNR
jgi:hypothetical protein